MVWEACKVVHRDGDERSKMIELTHYFAVAFVSWSVFCRARRMDASTPGRMKIQNGAVMLLALASLPVFGLDATPALLGLALTIYLLIDAIKWPPGSATGPRDLTMNDIRAVYGRGRK